MSHACTAEKGPSGNTASLPDAVVRIWRAQGPLGSAAFHEWRTPNGECTLRFHRMQNGYVLRFPDIADFVLSTDGLLTDVHAVPGVDEEVLASLCYNQVQPLSQSHLGKLVLHAGAVEMAGGGVEGAVLFLGRSGTGKSTMVQACAREGFRFLSDDCARFVQDGDRMQVLPGQAGIRLRRDSAVALLRETPAHAGKLPPAADRKARRKVLVPAGNQLQHCPQARPVLALYLLEPSGTAGVSIRATGAREALMALLEHSFLLDIEEQAVLRRHFAQLSALVRQSGVFGLSYPREYQYLPQVVDEVMRHVRKRLEHKGL